VKNLNSIINQSKQLLHIHAPIILTAVGVSGTVTTAFLAARAGNQAANRIGENSPGLNSREQFELTWDLYLPPVITGSVTVAAIVMAAHVSSKRAAAAYSVLALTERTLEEYREKVVEVIGSKKEQTIRDSIAQDRVNANPPSMVVSDAPGVLCCELYTGRYFQSDMESLKKAQNEINAKVLSSLYVSLDEFYYIMGIESTTNSGGIGWDSDKLMSLEFSTVFGPQNRPCLAFEYNYLKSL